ncbi:MAG: SMP-30/gluconolactonase/LRE family protein [Terriglobia bacterium]
MTEHAQAQSVNQVIRMDPGFDEIAPASAQIERIATGFSFVEGPVWVREGNYLLFSDIPNNVINKWEPGSGRTSVYLEQSGFSGKIPRAVPKQLTMENLLEYLVGSNGTTLDSEGRLIFCEHGNRRVERLEKDGRRTVVADRYDGKRLNSPNDVVTKSDGSIYFSDPPFGLEKMDADPRKELPFNGVYRVKDGKIQLLTKDMKAPNGLAFSPDEKHLYIDDSGAGTYMRYEVKPDGTIENGQLFFDLSKSPDQGVTDGIKIDHKGNVYACGPGGVWILSPEGKLLGRLKPPEEPANIAWGDDGKTLYMTAWTSVYRIRLKIPGIRP